MNDEEKFGSWQYNVIDEFKSLEKEEISEKVQERSLPFAIMMAQITRDFNYASVIRSANFLGAREIFHYGHRRYDRRATEGCYHYSPPKHLSSFEEILSLKDRYAFVALENNLNFQPIDIRKFDWNVGNKYPCVLVGEESCGLSQEILDICDFYIEITGRGSIRSLNAAVAASIAMQDLISKRFSNV